ncbi:6-carboxytetrahydropterin synthase QueD [Treponema sp. HNW]|uniref:6-carboxytetrahydropterin synthase QueD n=1 Tax=Treponema sp. HNW TaxID=3116654 RepID=UPI003D0F9365
MYEVSVEAEFAAAHFLADFHGKCENLHGHNYRVKAYVRGETLDEGGMLMDFGILKGALRDVCKSLDHSHLNEVKENGVPVFQNNPSAERIARFIFVQLEKRIPSLPDARLYAVDVFETPVNRARYIGRLCT